MSGYYREKLSAGRLERVYAIAPPRVLQYLDAEIDHVLASVRPADAVLELGCGCGRVLGPLARKARIVCGIDTSFESLAYGSAALEPLETARSRRWMPAGSVFATARSTVSCASRTVFPRSTSTRARSCGRAYA